MISFNISFSEKAEVNTYVKGNLSADVEVFIPIDDVITLFDDVMNEYDILGKKRQAIIKSIFEDYQKNFGSED